MPGNREDPSLRGTYDPRGDRLQSSPAAKPETYQQIKKDGTAKANSPDEKEEAAKDPFYQIWQKGWLTRSQIYERKLPGKGNASALRIDGPADAGITLDSFGNIFLLSGKRTPQRGPDSGKLNITCEGGMHTYGGTLDCEHVPDKPKGDALRIKCHGNFTEQIVGCQKTISANIIYLDATSELVLKGGSIRIESDSDILMSASSIRTAQQNKEDIVLGQLMKFGVSEETSIQFDPRASVNIVSPGHINHKILGDYKQWIGGVEQHIVAGATLSVPFIKDRTSAYSIKTLALPISIDAATIITQKAGGAITLDAGAALTSKAIGGIFIDAGGIVQIDSKLDTKVKALKSLTMESGLEFEIKNALGATIKTVGPIIYLN